MQSLEIIDISFLAAFCAIVATVVKLYGDNKKNTERRVETDNQVRINAKNIAEIKSQLVPLETLKDAKNELEEMRKEMISRELFDDTRKRVDILANQTEAILAMQSEIKTLFKTTEKTNDKIDHIDNKIDNLLIALNNK